MDVVNVTAAGDVDTCESGTVVTVTSANGWLDSTNVYVLVPPSVADKDAGVTVTAEASLSVIVAVAVEPAKPTRLVHVVVPAVTTAHVPVVSKRKSVLEAVNATDDVCVAPSSKLSSKAAIDTVWATFQLEVVKVNEAPLDTDTESAGPQVVAVPLLLQSASLEHAVAPAATASPGTRQWPVVGVTVTVTACSGATDSDTVTL